MIRLVVLLPGTDLSVDLKASERVVAFKAANGYFASKNQPAPKPYVVITNQRFIVYNRRGMMKTRLDEVASWPLRSFTERINTSEGSALGSFMHVLTLFVNDGETISTGFHFSQDCENFKHMVVAALWPVSS